MKKIFLLVFLPVFSSEQSSRPSSSFTNLFKLSRSSSVSDTNTSTTGSSGRSTPNHGTMRTETDPVTGERRILVDGIVVTINHPNPVNPYAFTAATTFFSRNTKKQLDQTCASVGEISHEEPELMQ